MKTSEEDRRSEGLLRQVRRLERRLRELNRTSNLLSWISVAIFFVGLVVCAITYFLIGAWLFCLTLIVTFVLFGLSFHRHQLIDKGIAKYQGWLQIKSAHIARINLDWDSIPANFHHDQQHDHPFESDLNIVGNRSLHQLVDTAISYEGSTRLREWITSPEPEMNQITHRQALLRELIPSVVFRDKLILNGMLATRANKVWDADSVVKWLKQHTQERSFYGWLVLSAVLAAANITLVILNLLEILPLIWPYTFGVYFTLILVGSRFTSSAFQETMELEDALRQLTRVFGQLETYPYHNKPHLRQLCSPFLVPGHRPSEYVRRITRIMTAMGIRSNTVVWAIFNTVVPWDLYFTYRLNQHKKELAHYVSEWMDLWFELEALCSLANFAYLNPSYTLPHIFTPEGQKRDLILCAQELGHPLLAKNDKICNDFSITKPGEVFIITGSNMAGKSVFLKAIGINMALAYAGGPVNADSLKTSIFRIYTCMRVADSLSDGISYFYAEVKRLKHLLSQLEDDHKHPLLFCIDELFRGTNNRERLIGGRAYVSALAGKHGVGLIATHDLELARLANETPHITNYHFRDELRDGHMVFDYTLRPGPCPTTNALKIMQSEGLPVNVIEAMASES